VEAILSKSRYLTGNTITEADVRLFTTLVRFDMVYVGHFKVFKSSIRIILDIKLCALIVVITKFLIVIGYLHTFLSHSWQVIKDGRFELF